VVLGWRVVACSCVTTRLFLITRDETPRRDPSSGSDIQRPNPTPKHQNSSATNAAHIKPLSRHPPNPKHPPHHHLQSHRHHQPTHRQRPNPALRAAHNQNRAAAPRPRRREPRPGLRQRRAVRPAALDDDGRGLRDVDGLHRRGGLHVDDGRLRDVHGCERRGYEFLHRDRRDGGGIHAAAAGAAGGAAADKAGGGGDGGAGVGVWTAPVVGE
jgi:hypothetical protein